MNKGSCLCGDITWQVEGQPQMMMNCHCSICRKIHGSDYATFVVYAADGFEWISGEKRVASYASSSAGARSFCPRCGSCVATLIPDGGVAFMPAGNLEGDIDKPLDSHVFVDSKAPWCELRDDVPKYSGAPPGYEPPDIESKPRPPKTAGAIGGSCQCGAISFEFDKPFERMGYCHCSLCRKAQSAARSSELFVEEKDFRWIRGSDKIKWFRVPDRSFGLQFCSDCSSPVPHLLADQELFLVPTGTLDADPGLRPMAHIFVGSKANWDSIDDDLPRFDEYPPGG